MDIRECRRRVEAEADGVNYAEFEKAAKKGKPSKGKTGEEGGAGKGRGQDEKEKEMNKVMRVISRESSTRR
jgi:hypothetical protein